MGRSPKPVRPEEPSGDIPSGAKARVPRSLFGFDGRFTQFNSMSCLRASPVRKRLILMVRRRTVEEVEHEVVSGITS
jgi:hypothetical protein